MAPFDSLEDAALEQLEKDQKRHEKMLPAAAVILLAVLAIISTQIFYQYLDTTLFQERNSHFIEISDKVTQLIESVVFHYRSAACTVEQLSVQAGLRQPGELPGRLREIQDCLGLEKGMVLALGSTGQLYSSDSTVSSWQNPDMLKNGEELQELVAALDSRTTEASHILFIKKLNNPLKLDGEQLTHAGIAVDISVFQEAFDSDIFAGQSHVYVIGPDGSRLYRHICEGGFIDSDNLLSALESYAFIHGGTAEDLRSCLKNRTSAGYEFYYGEERYFVAASPVQQTGWTTLTFVPTAVLGAGTTALLNTSVIYVSVIAALVVIMMGVAAFSFAAKRSDRRLLEQQRQINLLLQDTADAANAASLAKSNFLSHMSHDIRTPINGIMGMTDIALKNLEDPQRVLDCLKKIEGSSGHLLSLVNDVLDMSRIESGKIQIAHDPIDIRQVLEHCASIIGGQLQGRNLELVEEFEAFTHPHVLGDELRLRQVLINILGNAIKFTPDGGKIYFRAQEISAEENTVLFRLEVEDTGIGMKPEFIPHIFEAFAQEDGGTRSSYKGTGLGMAITKQFMDLMGGSIQVKSELNAGSRFILELPAELDQRACKTQENAPHAIKLAGMRLLLAEDNELNMEITQYMLQEEGIEITPVMDGQAALDAFSGSPPGTFDGILMDVMMPVMDGLSATRAIRALPREDAKTIPIIAMTANAYDEDKRRCLSAGMNAHIPKPINRAALALALSYYISQKTSQK